MKGIRFDGARTGALPNLSHLIYLRPRMPDRVFTPFRHTTRTSGQIISKCVPHPADTSPGHGSVKDFLRKYWTSGTPAPSMEPVDVHRRDKGQGGAFCSRAQPAPFCKKGRSKRRAKMRPSSTRQGRGQGSCIARPPQAQTSSQGGWVRRALNFRACGRLRLSPDVQSSGAELVKIARPGNSARGV